MKFRSLIICTYFIFTFIVNAQQIPSKKVVKIEKLSTFLTSEIKSKLEINGEVSTTKLASYFREKFSERYFYDWKNFDERFKIYLKIYPNNGAKHSERALDHISEFSDSTQWILPFNYLNGEPVNAYALRHLARQHKMVDIAFDYFYKNKAEQYLTYFKNQLKSLNTALHQDQYEKMEGGNGVYEAFRSGYRVLNWLQIHNMFLGEEAYFDEDQLTTIATLLQHGALLYKDNQEFHTGNHQTRGLSALAMLSILFRDFEGAAQWYDLSMRLLGEHMAKEINSDGFQFERTVHYHISDIGNYFYVYQLAKRSKMEVDKQWEEQLNSLFETLVKIAYPDKSAPVFSDDTNAPWAEKNDISNALTLGYVLFKNPVFGYFSNKNVESKMFWYLDNEQLLSLKNIDSEKPSYKSLHFDETGYYIMREGWDKKDKMIVITAGLDDKKPDHQHGDMLGIQAMANGNVIFPNYQVRYYLKDLELFKNSLTKNVALVDNELQGKLYVSNKGGSGFGKFKKLPLPKVIAWQPNKEIEFFVGSHNGFENIGVQYSRQLINVKNEFWIVKDNFRSKEPHSYKQVWQGHYSLENGTNLLRSSFSDGTGLDIFQLNNIDAVKTDGARGKEWSILEKKNQESFSFITVVHPFASFDKRIDETDGSKLSNWEVNNRKSFNSDATIIISNNNIFFLFEISKIENEKISIQFNEKSDVIIYIKKKIILQNIDDKVIGIRSKLWSGEKKINPGDSLEISTKKY